MCDKDLEDKYDAVSERIMLYSDSEDDHNEYKDEKFLSILGKRNSTEQSNISRMFTEQSTRDTLNGDMPLTKRRRINLTVEVS